MNVTEIYFKAAKFKTLDEGSELDRFQLKWLLCRSAVDNALIVLCSYGTNWCTKISRLFNTSHLLYTDVGIQFQVLCSASNGDHMNYKNPKADCAAYLAVRRNSKWHQKTIDQNCQPGTMSLANRSNHTIQRSKAFRSSTRNRTSLPDSLETYDKLSQRLWIHHIISLTHRIRQHKKTYRTLWIQERVEVEGQGEDREPFQLLTNSQILPMHWFDFL